MKKFFSIVEPFRIERGDFAALAMLLNVVLVISIGFPASWFGLAVAIIGMIIDMYKKSHINCLIMRISTIILNCYFLSLYYAQSFPKLD